MAVAPRPARSALCVVGLCVLLARAHGFGGDTMDVDRATSWLETMHASDSGPDPNTVNWTRCAAEGELCDCSYQKSAVRLIRYGSPGESEVPDRKWQWDYAHVEATADVLLCHPLSFMHRDPAPGFVKHCECAHARDESVPPTPPAVFDRGTEVVLPANRSEIGAPPPPPAPGAPPAPPPAPHEQAYVSPASPASPRSAVEALKTETKGAEEERDGMPETEVSDETLRAAIDTMTREETAEAAAARATAAVTRGMAPRLTAVASELEAMAPELADLEPEMHVVTEEMDAMASEAVTTASTVDDMVSEMEALAPEMKALESETETANATAKEAIAPEMDAMAARAQRTASKAARVASETHEMQPDMEALASQAEFIAGESEMRTVVPEIQSMTRDAAALDSNATRTASDTNRTTEGIEAVMEMMETATNANGTATPRSAFATTPATTAFAPEERALNPNDYEWTFCARDGSNDTCECATPGALIRFGSTGEPEYYAKGSTWFADHPSVRKFDYALLRPGETKAICDAATFSGSDPFPDQDKVCHCANRSVLPEDEPLVTFVPDARDVEDVEARRESNTSERDAIEAVAAVARAGKQPRLADVLKLPPIRVGGARGSVEAGSEMGGESIRASLGTSAVRQSAARYAESLARPVVAAAAAVAAAFATRRARRLSEETCAEHVALCEPGREIVRYGDDATV